MKKSFLLLILTAVIAFTASAQNLHVYLNNGEHEVYPLSEIRKLTNSETEITILKNDASSIVLSIADIKKFTYENGDFIPKVDALKMDAKIYPNPVKDFLRIDYELEKNANVCIDILTMNGTLVQTIVKEKQTKGANSIEWQNNNLKSGTYLVRINAGKQQTAQQIIIL